MSVQIPPKTPAEARTVQFDFLSALVPGEFITAATGEASVWTGTDPSPGAVVGGTRVSGSRVGLTVQGGIEGVIYLLTVTVTTSNGQSIPLQGLLAIVKAPA